MRAQDPPCPWSNVTCYNAAYGGHLEVLQWLRAQVPPCPWSDCNSAARGGRLEVLQWMRAQDPPCPWDPEECASEAAYHDEHEVVDWILNH
jgi:hypothetical protein